MVSLQDLSTVKSRGLTWRVRASRLRASSSEAPASQVFGWPSQKACAAGLPTHILPGICRTTSVFMIFVYFEGLADRCCGRRGSWIHKLGRFSCPPCRPASIETGRCVFQRIQRESFSFRSCNQQSLISGASSVSLKTLNWPAVRRLFLKAVQSGGAHKLNSLHPVKWAA